MQTRFGLVMFHCIHVDKMRVYVDALICEEPIYERLFFNLLKSVNLSVCRSDISVQLIIL